MPGYQITVSPGFEKSEKLNEQAKLYREAKVAYAKKNKVPLDQVTNEQVKEDVIKLYEINLTAKARQKLYEDDAQKGIGKFYGFKGIDDVFGDAEREKFSDLRDSYEKYLDSKEAKIVLQSQYEAFKIQTAEKITLSKTYETQEEIDEANAFLENLKIQKRANFKVYNENLDKMAERANTSKNAELFANLQKRNYGIITQGGGAMLNTVLELGIAGLLESGARYGLTELFIPPLAAKSIYD